jgi:hypothetical protein
VVFSVRSTTSATCASETVRLCARLTYATLDTSIL